MPMKKLVKQGLGTDCLNCDITLSIKLKNKFQIEEEGSGIMFFVGFQVPLQLKIA